MGMFDKPHKAS